MKLKSEKKIKIFLLALFAVAILKLLAAILKKSSKQYKIINFKYNLNIKF